MIEVSLIARICSPIRCTRSFVLQIRIFHSKILFLNRIRSDLKTISFQRTCQITPSETKSYCASIFKTEVGSTKFDDNKSAGLNVEGFRVMSEHSRLPCRETSRLTGTILYRAGGISWSITFQRQAGGTAPVMFFFYYY